MKYLGYNYFKEKKSQFVIIEIFREKKTKNKLSIVEIKERMWKGQTVSFACMFSTGFLDTVLGFFTTIIIYFLLYLLRRSLVKILFFVIFCDGALRDKFLYFSEMHKKFITMYLFFLQSSTRPWILCNVLEVNRLLHINSFSYGFVLRYVTRCLKV